MKISKSWLNDFVEVSDLSGEEFTEIITTKVAEVDDVTTVAQPLNDATVAAIQALSAHPEKANLKIATVATGSETRTVVCGAQNAAVGMLTAYLAPGSAFYDAESKLCAIENRQVAGVASQGILVSERELGLTSNHDGILELQAADGFKVGDRIANKLGGSDIVLEIDNKSLTHRPDLWSHFGFAREMSAILGRPLKRNIDSWADDANQGSDFFKQLCTKDSTPITTAIESTAARRFLGVSIEGVSAKASPLWLRRRLFAVGAGVRNVLVDLSNYVMNDIGQPNHAYDKALLNGNILSARFAKAGESFISLDEVERSLTEQDIVIADSKSAVALAGVIGGLHSSVNAKTTSLFLESANFDPTTVRLMTKRHTLRTDASNRFEKSQSAYSAPLAIFRFVELLKAIQPSATVVGSVSDAFAQRPKQVTVAASTEYIRQRLDDGIATKTVESILSSLNFKFAKPDAKGSTVVTVPYYRATRDIEIEDDLVEEVGRIYGYNSIAEQSPLIHSTASQANKLKVVEEQVRDFMLGASFSEVYDYSFGCKERNEALGYSINDAVLLQNPVDQTSNYLRTTLVPGFIDLLDRNARFFRELSCFEIGRSYERTAKPTHANLKIREAFNNPAGFERRLLALGYSSGKNESELATTATPAIASGADFYALAHLIKRLARVLGVTDISLTPIQSGQAATQAAGDFAGYRSWMHPYRAATIRAGSNATPIGVIAQVHPIAVSRISEQVVVAEIDLELLAEFALEVDSFKSISKFPDSLFEISVVMPLTDHFTQVAAVITSGIDTALLRRMDVISVYEGAPIATGHKSVSIQMAFGAGDRTLGNEEVQTLQQQVMAAVNASSYQLRC